MSAVVNPIAEATGTPIVPPPRADALVGTLGVLINGKEYSDVVLARLTAKLRERFPVGDVLCWNKRYPATAAPTPLLEEIAQRCSFVLNGVGH